MRRRPDPRDQQRTARVIPLFAELTQDGPVPAVKLIDGDSMMLAWRDTLWVKRRDVDQMSDRELRGMLAHELGHLRDPLRARDRKLKTVLGALFIPSALAVWTIVFVPLLAGWAIGWTVWRVALIVFAAAMWMALTWDSRRAEYRADALGARIGSAEDVIESLEHLRRRWWDRWADRLVPPVILTHPRIGQRRRALTGRGNRAARSALAVLQGSHGYDRVEK